MIYSADRILAEDTILEDAGIRVAVDGSIAEIVHSPRGLDVVPLGRRLLVPGTVNAHNHSFQSLLRGLGDDLPFLEWRDKALYHYSPKLGTDGILTGALFAFGEMLLHGVTTVCDFFYIQSGGNDNARAVMRAAQRLGIRLVLARCFYDWEGAPADYRESPADATRRFEELAKEAAGNPLVRLQPAPHSLHGASEAMIRAGADAAERAGVPYHIHLAEERYQVDDALGKYGVRPLFALEKMGVLSKRTIAIHGCWFDESERALLSERGAALVYNPNSNMFLGDGVTDVVDLVRRKVPVALGTDGGCSNSRVSIFDEMRACALLQKVSKLDGQAIDAETCFRMGTIGGGEVLGLPVGRLATGYAADFVALDLDDLSLFPQTSVRKNLVYSLSARAVVDVFVAGRPVVRDRTLVGAPLAEIHDRVRRLTRDWAMTQRSPSARGAPTNPSAKVPRSSFARR